MDFASLMSSEISKKSSKKTAEPEAQSKKYLKRSDVEAQRQADYRAEQAAIERQRIEKAEKKRRAEEEATEREAERKEKRRKLAEQSARLKEEAEWEAEQVRRKRLGLPELQKKDAEKEETPLPEGVEDVEDSILKERLRELGEPVVLFGETHAQRLKRWRNLAGLDAEKKVKMTDGPIPTSLELLPEKDMQVPATLPKDSEARTYLFRQLASYFTMVLIEWERALRSRSAEVKNSSTGKQAFNNMLQARENMKPLFRKMEKNDVEDGILDPVIGIVRAAQERRYVDANDKYLTLSIGKAAWPIGVTMVGIHERSAREKLNEGDKEAHIMGDEVTRKFLQSIKRCLSFAQTRWPPDDQLQLMG